MTNSKTLYAIAKANNMRPQHLYNLARNNVIKTSKVTCELGEQHVVVDQESLEAYFDRRNERAAKKQADTQAELNA